MPFSTFWKNETLDHLFNKGAYTAPTIYLALLTAADVEPDATGSYARKQTAAADWEVASSGATQNAAEIAFATSTAAWSTGATNLTKFAGYDAASAGNQLFVATLTTPRAVNAAGVTLSFAAGALDVQITDP